MSKMKVMCLCGLQPCEAHPSTMSTVDIERLLDGKSMEFVKDGKTYHVVPLYTAVQLAKEAARTHNTTLKAELLAKMPKPAEQYFDDAGHNTFIGYNQAITEITKIVNEL